MTCCTSFISGGTMGKLINFEYACIQGSYWMFYGISSSFASVFLLACGYSNAEIGIILAVANILACIFQPIIADIGDKVRRISIIEISQLLTVVLMIFTVGLFFFMQKSLALSLTFVMLMVWHTVLQPLFNSMTFKLEECGIRMNFGIARSVGSLAYSVLVAILGFLVEKFGISVLPVTGEVILAMLLLSLVMIGRHYKKAAGQRSNAAAQHNDDATEHHSIPAASKQSDSETAHDQNITSDDDYEAIGLVQFIRNNRMFLAVNFGVIGLYFSNSILNSYMIQIVTFVGGSSDDMGTILAYMAALEIPAMVCFTKLRKRFSCETMLKAASVGFTLKIMLCWLADSVAMIFAAQTFQLVAFGLFLTAMVHFIDEIMEKGEAVKGQALFTTMVTVTTVFSSILGGIILDISNARMLTFIATIATAIGSLIIFMTVGRVKNSKK